MLTNPNQWSQRHFRYGRTSWNAFQSRVALIAQAVRIGWQYRRKKGSPFNKAALIYKDRYLRTRLVKTDLSAGYKCRNDIGAQ